MKNQYLSTYLHCPSPFIQSWRIYYFPVLDSTNVFLKRLFVPIIPTLCFCDIQINGQGRNGAWKSLFNGNLYLSWAFPTFSFRSSLPLEIALALAEVLAEFAIPVLLKWPNDFVLQGKKVGGLLIEKLSDRLIIGVGLNITQSPRLAVADFPLSSLREEGFFALRQDFLIPFSQAVIKVVEQSNDQWQKSWQKKDFLRNQWIRWEETELKIGQALGIAADGALIVQEFGRQRLLYQAKKIRLL